MPPEDQLASKASLRALVGPLAATFAGFGLGWLVSLSRSEILSVVIPAMLTAAIGAVPVIKALRGTADASSGRADLLLLALLTLGLAGGATTGALAVAHAWFAPRPEAFARLADGLSDDALKRRYLEALVPTLSGGPVVRPPLESSNRADGPSDQCHRALQILRGPRQADAGADEALRDAIAGDPAFEAQTKGLSGTDLEKKVREVCAGK